MPRHIPNALPPTTPESNGTLQLKTDLHHITFSYTDTTPNKRPKEQDEPQPKYNSKRDSVTLGMVSFPLVTKEAEEGAEAKEEAEAEEEAEEVVVAAP